MSVDGNFDCNSVPMLAPSIDFLLKQVWGFHKLKIDGLNDELSNCRLTINELKAKIEEQEREIQHLTQKPELKSVETQVNKYSFGRTKKSCLRPEDLSCSPRSKISRPSPSNSVKKVQQWLHTCRESEILAPETPEEVQICQEKSAYTEIIVPETVQDLTLAPGFEIASVFLAPKALQVVQIISEHAEMQPISQEFNKQQPVPDQAGTLNGKDSAREEFIETVMIEDDQNDVSKLDKQIDLNKTVPIVEKTKSTTPTLDNDSPSYEEASSELIVSPKKLRQHFSKRSKLSRRKSKKINCSPSIFSSPDVEIKREILNSQLVCDFNETMLPEELIQLRANVAKQEIQSQPESEDLLACIAQPSPDKRTNEISSFDQVIQPNENAGLNYKYKDGPVRKRIDRQRLKGFECQDCAKYYEDMGLSDSEKQRRMQQCSRHRATHAPAPCTPEHFWDLEFPETPVCKARGYIKETQVVPLKGHRKRPLKMRN